MKNLMRLTKLDLFIKKNPQIQVTDGDFFLKLFLELLKHFLNSFTALPSIYKLQMRIVQTFEKKITAALEIYENEHLKV